MTGPALARPRRSWRAAAREVLRVERQQISPVTGAITAIPVAGILAIGLATAPVGLAIAAAVGAELIGIVSLTASPRLSVPLALADAAALALSAFVGTLSVGTPWLHVALLVPLCYAAGLLVALGQTPAAIGTQSIIAFLLLGQFAGSWVAAAQVGAAVVVGAVGQVLALLVLRLPPSLRYQRLRLVNAVTAVATLARGPASGSAIPALRVLDEAEDALSSPALFGRSDVRDLRATLEQLKRVRLELTALAGLRLRLPGSPAAHPELAAARAAVADELDGIAATLRSGRVAPAASDPVAAALAHLGTAETPFDDVVVAQYVAHLRALAGQLRALRLGAAEAVSEERRAWHVSPTWRRAEPSDARTAVAVLHDGLSLNTSSGRHALRLAVAVPLATAIALAFHLARGYWVPFAVAVVLRADYATLLRRGSGRVAGTALGAAGAALLIGVLRPDLGTDVLLVALLAWAAFTTWTASFPLGVTFITALVLVLLSTSLPDPSRTALDRLVDVALGGAIAVASYLVWPTSAEAGVRASLSGLFAALRAYLAGSMRLVAGTGGTPESLSSASRAARVAWGRAEAAVGRSVEEPSSSRFAPASGRALLAVTLRILRATHGLRLGAERGETAPDCPGLDALAAGLDAALSRLAARVAGQSVAPPPANLRPLYDQAAVTLEARGGTAGLVSHLDELVDALNAATRIADEAVA